MEKTAQRRVLAVYAHPDDAEIWAGGTLLAHRAAGDHTAVCIATHGDGPRAAEARQGMAALGAELYQFALQDRAVTADRAAIEAISAVFRRERPQIVLTHWDADSHPDHRAVWQIVHASILLAEVERDIQAVFWSDTYNSMGVTGIFQPDCLIDVTAFWEGKLEALNAHQSQGPAHYAEMTGRQCAAHGSRSGVAFAEGFKRVPLFGRGQRAATTLWQYS